MVRVKNILFIIVSCLCFATFTYAQFSIINELEDTLKKVSSGILPEEEGANKLLSNMENLTTLDLNRLIDHVECRISLLDSKENPTCEQLISERGIKIEIEDDSPALMGFLLLAQAALTKLRFLSLIAGMKFIAAELLGAWALGAGSVALGAGSSALSTGSSALSAGSALSSTGSSALGNGSTFLASKAITSSLAGLGLFAGLLPPIIPPTILSAVNTTIAKELNISFPPFLNLNESFDFSSFAANSLGALFTGPETNVTAIPLDSLPKNDISSTGLFSLPMLFPSNVNSLDAEMNKVISFTGISSLFPFLRQSEDASLEPGAPRKLLALPLSKSAVSKLNHAIQNALSLESSENLNVNASLIDTFNDTGFRTLQLLIPLNSSLSTSLFKQLSLFPGINTTFNSTFDYDFEVDPNSGKFIPPFNISLSQTIVDNQTALFWLPFWNSSFSYNNSLNFNGL